MIIRTLLDLTVVVINTAKWTDEEFLAVNTTGGFSSVSSLPTSKWSKWKVVDGLIVVDTVAEAVCESNVYKQQRGPEYPPIVDQLDMQYWDAINGTTTWLEAIQVVKGKYSKPEIE